MPQSATQPDDSLPLPPEPDNTSTQVGAIAECLVSAAILQASKGRLAPFKPVADDDGIDLLLFNKDTRQAASLQIKCRRNFDNDLARTTQFDVRRKTFSEKGEAYFLFLKVSEVTIEHIWLLTAADLKDVARQTDDRFICRPSAKPTAKDSLAPFRMTSFEEVAARILRREEVRQEFTDS